MIPDRYCNKRSMKQQQAKRKGTKREIAHPGGMSGKSRAAKKRFSRENVYGNRAQRDGRREGEWQV